MNTRKLSRLALLLIPMSFLAGCSEAPTAAIEAANKTLTEARSAGSSEYLADEDKAVNDKLEAALQEIKAQDEKMAILRKYDQAEQLLAEAKLAGEKLQADTTAKKDQAKNDAVALRESAGQAIFAAKALLEQAPAGKGTEADIAALHSDLSALEESLPSIQESIDQGDFLGAIGKAKPIEEKAVAVSSEISQAIEKIRLAESQKKMKPKATTPMRKKQG